MCGMAEGNWSGISWFGIVVPKDTPAPIVQRLRQASLEAVQLPDVKEHLRKLGATPTRMDQGQFAAEITAEIQRNKALLDKAGVKPE